MIDGVAEHSMEWLLIGVAVFSALLGLVVAYWMYLKQPSKPASLAKSMGGVYTTLLHKYYVDELYAAVIVAPLMWISRNVLWKVVDVEIVDGAVNGIAHGASEIGDATRHTQSGNTRSYAVWVVIGAILVIAVVFWVRLQPPVVGMVR